MRTINPRRVTVGTYAGQVPFSHIVIDGLLLPDFCREVADAFPSADSRAWLRYDNPLERKNVTNNRMLEPPEITALYDTLSDVGFLDLIEQITEQPEALVWDDSLHAAGLCVATGGSKLDLHRDANLHPHEPWRRAITAVLFLNDDWRPEWGGNLEFWSERDGRPFDLEKSIEPKLGRLVLFDPNGYHGYPEPLSCPEGIERKTVQVFYWSQAESANNGRKRALFAPRPHDPKNPELDQLRLSRSM